MACSDDETPTPATPTADAAPEAATLTPDTGNGGKRDCAADLDSDLIPKHLDCSGMDGAEVKPYKPAIEFWSDGAEKSRFVLLPAGSKIDISDWNEWKFPNGTKLWKEFKLQGKKIETRLYAKLDDGTWGHATYRWNDAQTEATRLQPGEKIPGLGPDGGIYEIPTFEQCTECHQGKKDSILGFDAVSLGLPGATGVTLATLESGGWLSAKAPATSLTIPNDSTTKGAAALGWVHANCGACHNQNDFASAGHIALKMQLRADDLAPADGGAAKPFAELAAYQTGYCIATNHEDDAGVKYLYLSGGKPERSYAAILSGQREGEPNPAKQMPPLVTRAVDPGQKQLVDWISALPACPL